MFAENIPRRGERAVESRDKRALKSAKLPKSNIGKQERSALKDLRWDDTITILHADKALKGRATVAMDSASYKKVKILGDERTYTKLKAVLTPKYREACILTVSPQGGELSQPQYRHLCPTTQDEIIARLYYTPKIHKPGSPL